MLPARAALTVLLTCAVSVSGCGASEDMPWDGNYDPLPERGNWEDTGALAECRVKKDGAADCGSLEFFDLSDCKTRTLKKLKLQGVYRAGLRFESSKDPTLPDRPQARGGGFMLRPNGTFELVFGRPTEKVRWADEQLWFSSRGEDDEVYSFVACEAQDDRRLTGCFSVCRSGWLEEFATFRAESMAWFEGENQSSGNIPQLSETVVDAGTPVAVHVTKEHAYVVSERRGNQPGGLTIFDVSNPRDPRHVGFRRMGDSDWRSVTSSGGILYVASTTSGVLVFDITNPADPVRIPIQPGGPLHVSNLRAEGDRLYATVVTPQPGTLVFDISTPDAPLLLHEVTQGSRAVRPLARGSADWHEGLLYVNHRHEGFKVLDVSDSDNVRLVGSYKHPNINSHSSAVGEFAGRTVAFELSQGLGGRVRALDVTNPAAIKKMGQYSLRHVVSPGSVELVGSRLYLAYHHEGLRVVDVSTPSNPRQVAYFNTFRSEDPGRGDGPAEGATGLHVPGDGYIYLVDTSRGLLIFTEPP